MAWFLRAIELPDGGWACREGRFQHDSHVSLEEALDHLRSLSLTLGATTLFAHHLDGRVVSHGPAHSHVLGR